MPFVTLRPFCLEICLTRTRLFLHDDVIKWKLFPRYRPFVRGIYRSPVNSSHKGQWRGALMSSLICAWIHGRVNNREAGDLIRHRAHYDVTAMESNIPVSTFQELIANWKSINLFKLEQTSYNMITNRMLFSTFDCGQDLLYTLDKQTWLLTTVTIEETAQSALLSLCNPVFKPNWVMHYIVIDRLWPLG